MNLRESFSMLRRTMRQPLAVFMAAWLFMAVGCGRPPAVEHHNLSLVSSLRTAVSARNATWLTGVERAVEARFSDGRMSAEERAHFQQLIQLARQGEWEAADRASFEFEQAQLSRRRSASDG